MSWEGDVSVLFCEGQVGADLPVRRTRKRGARRRQGDCSRLDDRTAPAARRRSPPPCMCVGRTHGRWQQGYRGRRSSASAPRPCVRCRACVHAPRFCKRGPKTAESLCGDRRKARVGGSTRTCAARVVCRQLRRSAEALTRSACRGHGPYSRGVSRRWKEVLLGETLGVGHHSAVPSLLAHDGRHGRGRRHYPPAGENDLPVLQSPPQQQHRARSDRFGGAAGNVIRGYALPV